MYIPFFFDADVKSSVTPDNGRHLSHPPPIAEGPIYRRLTGKEPGSSQKIGTGILEKHVWNETFLEKRSMNQGETSTWKIVLKILSYETFDL